MRIESKANVCLGERERERERERAQNFVDVFEKESVYLPTTSVHTKTFPIITFPKSIHARHFPCVEFHLMVRFTNIIHFVFHKE